MRPPSSAEDASNGSQGVSATPLEALVAAAASIDGVRRAELVPGDRLVVSTQNSIYILLACENGRFVVSGGWFARHGDGERTLAVNGCTAGGRALFSHLVAAPHLFLEFGDGTTTTRIRRVRRIPAAGPGQG